MRPLHTESDQFKPCNYAATVDSHPVYSSHSFHCFSVFANTQRINNEIQVNLNSQLKGIAYAHKSARGARRLRTKISIESYPCKSGPGVPRSPVSTASAVSHSENLGVDCEGLGGGSE
jgi:hypothetical protein